VHRNLAIADLGDLVELPLVAVLATRRRDGTLLLSPVWHEYRDGGFNVCTATADVKARHLRHDPRAVLLVAESQPPYRGVELTTRATFTQDNLGETLLRIAGRYLGEAGARSYAETASDDVVVRLVPGQVRAWDFADTY
jgi:PPOX class probable F420-dependent enzyme